jgi:hypothetical protein
VLGKYGIDTNKTYIKESLIFLGKRAVARIQQTPPPLPKANWFGSSKTLRSILIGESHNYSENPCRNPLQKKILIEKSFRSPSKGRKMFFLLPLDTVHDMFLFLTP